MNEKYLIIGLDKDGKGYYAMWANESLVIGGKNPEEAVKNLFDYQYPEIWVNESNKKSFMIKSEGIKIDKESKFLGTCKKFIRRIK